MAEKNQDMSVLLATPEAQKAIAEAASLAAAKAVADLMKGSAAVLPGDSQTQRLFSEMALAIAEMNHQGSGRPKPLAPEVMAKREAASKQLDSLVTEVNEKIHIARGNGDKKMLDQWMPVYRVTGKIYFNEELIEPFSKPDRRGDKPVPTVRCWTGYPNHSLHPKNAIAKRLVDLFRESVGAAPLLKSVSGPNGGQAAQDNRKYYLTPLGHVVKGETPGSTTLDEDDGVQIVDRRSIDPTAPFAHVLGTVAQPARQNSQANPQPNAAQLSQM